MENSKTKSKKFRITWRGRRKNLTKSSKNIKEVSSSERPNRPLKLRGNYENTRMKSNLTGAESRH
jgi:hypothetical protein